MTKHLGTGTLERDPEPPIDEATRTKNVFVVGYDAYQAELLGHLANRDGYAVHPLLDTDELRGVDQLPFERLLHAAEGRLERFPGPIDAIVTFLDFPAIEIMAILAERHGARAPSLRATLKCNHKYWSRLLQRRVVPDHVPPFATFDPWDDDALENLGLDFPFWIKPFNAFRSLLGFRVNGPSDFARALPLIRDELPRIAAPFGQVMERLGDVPELRGVSPDHCLAEGIIGGRQCTLEGYVFEGDVGVYGVVDSIREANRSSFSRYQYPSALPRHVQDRMTEVVERVMPELEFKDGSFNAEFFYDEQRERVWLLEINARISQSHCELFERVDGESNQKVALDIALGRRPDPPYREGRYAVAGKFFVRVFSDGVVRRVPRASDLDRLEKEVPGVTWQLQVEEGMLLSELHDQDSYSFELAWLWIGADSQHELLERYRRAVSLLGFELERPDGTVQRVEP
ncbi:MAG: ATP-grasp domain-containing protein [Gemmatimonadota bacterium]|nr:ATP-grasp domain-containing protein [Gemmatimonadota bacterium]